VTTSVPQFRIETPLSTVTVPGALITVTVRAPGKPPVSCSLHAEKVRADRYSRTAHVKMQQSIANTVRDHDLTDFTPSAAGVACAALWCLVNDPKERDDWRRKLSAFLHSNKQAFVAFDLRDDGRYVYAIDAQPLLLGDLERAASEAPQMNAEAEAKLKRSLS
jgi:hypothetical protein